MTNLVRRAFRDEVAKVLKGLTVEQINESANIMTCIVEDVRFEAVASVETDEEYEELTNKGDK